MPGSSFSEMNPVASSFLKATAVGGGAAALSALISDVIEAKRQKKRRSKKDSSETDENTVVLYVGGKGGRNGEKSAECRNQACGDGAQGAEACNGSGLRVEPAVTSSEVRYRPEWGQPRTSDGRYSSMDKTGGAERILNNAGSIVASVIGLPTGYFAVQALHKRLEENRLKKQIAAAQKEYVDLLEGKPVKNAEAFISEFLLDDPVYGIFGSEKTAQAGRTAPRSLVGSLVSAGDKVLTGAGDATSAMLAAMLLTGGASAWLTHRILANKFDKKDGEEDPKKVTRVVFKHASSESEVDERDVIGTIAVMRSLMTSGFEKDAYILTDMSKPADERDLAEKSMRAVWDYYDELRKNDPRLTENQFVRGVYGGSYDSELNSRIRAARGNGMWGNAVGRIAGVFDSDYIPSEKVKKIPQADLLASRYYLQGRSAASAPDWKGPSREDLIGALYDRYGERFGIRRDPKYSGAAMRLAGMLDNPDTTDRKSLESAVMQYMGDHSDQWIDALGTPEGRRFREGAIDYHFNNSRNSGNGFWGQVYAIPIIGPIIESIARWVASTPYGQRKFLERTLVESGVDPSEAARIAIEDYDYMGEGGGWKRKNGVEATEGIGGAAPAATGETVRPPTGAVAPAAPAATGETVQLPTGVVAPAATGKPVQPPAVAASPTAAGGGSVSGLSRVEFEGSPRGPFPGEGVVAPNQAAPAAVTNRIAQLSGGAQ